MNSLCVLTLNTLAGYRSPDKQASLRGRSQKSDGRSHRIPAAEMAGWGRSQGRGRTSLPDAPWQRPFFVRLHPLNNSALVVLQHEFPGVVLDAAQHVKSRRG